MPIKKMRHEPLNHRKQAGFTLVELMVSLLLGLILISGVLSVFLSNRQNFQVSENMARIQENSRVAFDLVSRDLREAGETPCGSKLVANLVRSGGAIPWWADWNAGSIRGYAGSTNTTDMVGFGTTTNARVNGTDAFFTIQTSGTETNITSHDSASFDFILNSVSGLDADDIVVACDLQSAAIFQIATINAGSKTINYDPSFTTLNCGSGLAYPNSIACATTAVKTFDTTNAQIAPVKSSFWYIGVGSNGKNSLYRTRITKKTVGGAVQVTTDKDEILQNISNMSLRYLTKDLTTDSLASAWVAADNGVFSSANGGWSDTNNNQVVAVRLELTFQSDEAVSTTNTNIERKQTYVVGLRSRDTLFQVTP